MNDKLKLMLVAGARPNFMKVAPLIRAIQQRSDRLEYVLVHTGQHYDEGMSDIFFRDLGIPKPHHHLNVGSGTHAVQTAAIMTKFEPVLISESPDCVLVFGDVNSTLACSIVAKKLSFPVAHVEAGLRSGDRDMPEEINRIVTDSITDHFFITEPSGVAHLEQEGHSRESLHYVGHVMIDNLYFEVEKLERDADTTSSIRELIERFENYGVVTLHRPSNVDDKAVLAGIVAALGEIGERLPLIFPIHPRTRAKLNEFGLSLPASIIPLEPLGYRDFLALWRKARLVLTDSGGLQEETTALGIPCLTLRKNTERPVTVDEGTNRLIGNNPADIRDAAFHALENRWSSKRNQRPGLWDGKASLRILDILEKELSGLADD